MTNYATYTEVEKIYFGIEYTGSNWSTTQRTAITGLCTEVHKVIVTYLGSEPTSTDALVFVEATGVCHIVTNAKNKNNPNWRPIPTLSEDLRAILDKFLTQPGNTDGDEGFGQALLRDYKDYYGV